MKLDVSLKGLEKAWYKKDNYNFTKDEDGNSILVEKTTGNVICDEYFINKYKILFAWLKAIKKITPSCNVEENIIDERVLDHAFGEGAHEVYATLMENVRQQLLNNGEVDILIAKNSVENLNYKYAKDIADTLLSSEEGLMATINWVSTATPELQRKSKSI